MKKIFLFASFFILIISCNLDKDTITPSIGYSGETLFRGIFLLEGEVSEKIISQSPIVDLLGQLFKEKPELLSKFKEKNNDIVKKVFKIDPHYFDNLKAAISSKVVDELEYNIKRGNDLIATVLLPDFYSGDYSKEANKIISSVNINEYNTSTNEGLEEFFQVVKEKVKSIPISIKLKQASQYGSLVNCVWAVIAVVVWAVVAVINYGLLVNVSAAVNAAVAVNVINVLNVQTHSDEAAINLRRVNSNYQYENRINEIFSLSTK